MFALITLKMPFIVLSVSIYMVFVIVLIDNIQSHLRYTLVQGIPESIYGFTRMYAVKLQTG